MVRKGGAPSVLVTSSEPPPRRARKIVMGGRVMSPSESNAMLPSRPRSTCVRRRAATTDLRDPSARAIASSRSSAACAA
jgi:hypothetical protein